MKFTNLKEETLESIKAFSISGVIIVLFFQLVNNLRWLGGFFSSALQALAPFLFGIVFAFITVPLRRFVENDLLANVKWSKKTKRYVGVAAAMIVLLAGIVVFFAILIPQLASSLSIFIASFDGYVQTLREIIEKVFFYGLLISLYRIRCRCHRRRCRSLCRVHLDGILRFDPRFGFHFGHLLQFN